MAITKTLVLQDAAGATGNGEMLDLQGAAVVNVHVIIGNTATVTFEVSLDRVVWSPLMMTSRANSATTATTATATGMFWANVHGVMAFRCRISAWTSGDVDAIGSSYTVE